MTSETQRDYTWEHRISESDDLAVFVQDSSRWCGCALGESLGFPTDKYEADVKFFFGSKYPKIYQAALDFDSGIANNNAEKAVDAHDYIKREVTPKIVDEFKAVIKKHHS